MGEGRPWRPSHARSTLPWASSLLLLLGLLLALPWSCLAKPVTMETPQLCPSVCNCTTWDGGTAASCIHGGLTNIPPQLPAALVSLDLQGNEITMLDNLSLLEGLLSLDLSNNSLSELTKGSLDSMFRLSVLDLSFNAIHTVEDHVFGSLSAITEVNLAFNQLTSLDSGTVFGLRTVRVLNLTHNLISELSNQTFLYLHHMEVLDLSHNSLDYLSTDAFHGLESVQSILLQHNQLFSVTGAFHGLHNLHDLDLSHNALQALENDTFTALPHLNILRLSFNNITEISNVFCGKASNVETLELEGNSIEQLEGRVFEHFPMLQVLDLSQMPYLQTIGFDVFDGAHSLSALNLSLNPQLSFLHPQLLDGLPKLSVLDLRSNNVSTLSHITFHSNPHLQRLFLSHNPWQCGCGLAWVTRTSPADNTSVADLQQIQCQLQSNRTAVPISQLTQEMLQCNNVTLVNVTNLVLAPIGSQVVLTCDYEADETTVLTWTTARGLTFHYHPFHPDATSHLVDREDAENLTSDFHRPHWWHWDGSYNADYKHYPDHVTLLSDGSLFIDFVVRSDGGPYTCTVHNAHSEASVTITLHLDTEIQYVVKIMSLIVGMACAATFFMLNTVYVVIMWIARKLVNKRRRDRINALLVSLDEYRTSQITRIRTNYSMQLTRIRDHYNSQSMRLKENYTSQVKRVRRGCSNQVDRIRDNYHASLTHLKDYSSHQIQQIREATNTQIVRIRDYGSLQMERLRETYKLQQQHVIKVIEAMNLENCRSVVETECMRTESMIFDINFPDLDVDVDTDNTSSDEVFSQASQNESVYATALGSDNSSLENEAAVEARRNCPLAAENLTIEVLPSHSPVVASSPAHSLPSDSCSYSADCEGEGDTDAEHDAEHTNINLAFDEKADESETKKTEIKETVV